MNTLTPRKRTVPASPLFSAGSRYLRSEARSVDLGYDSSVENLSSVASSMVSATPPRNSRNPSNATSKIDETESADEGSSVLAARKPSESFGIFSFLKNETCWTESEAPDPDAKIMFERIAVNNFVQVPFGLEKVVTFGFFVCADQLLYLFTFLPMRISRAITLCLLRQKSLKYYFYEASNISDLIRGFLLVLGVSVLLLLDLSQIYHYIRGQSTIKLYVVFNVLEIMDKLCSSVGQQLLDSTCASASGFLCKQGKGRLKVLLIDWVVCSGHLLIHSVLLLLQVVTLNVAINSQNNALLTLLVSNNFVELKSNVFKKFEVQNLMQITCADIVERFTLFVFLTLVTLQKMPFTSQLEPWLYQWAYLVVIVFLSEVMIDWIKHFFICKFNKIESVVYPRFARVLYEDIARCWLKLYEPQLGLDESQSLSRRIGFVPLPLACVIIRVCMQAICNPTSIDCAHRLTSVHVFTFLLSSWLCLCAIKALIHIFLLSLSCQRLSTAQRNVSDKLTQIHRFSVHGRVQF